MNANEDDIRRDAATTADELAAAIREGRTSDARALLPGLGDLLATLEKIGG